MRSIWLAYHDVHDAEARDVERHVGVYDVSRARFAEHVAVIRASGLRVITALEFARGCAGDSVVMTFDDGCRGAFEIAAPMLRDAGCAATFYVTRDLIGRERHGGAGSILDVSRVGMEIGVHGATHRSFSECSWDEVRHELSAGKRHVESLIGRPVVSASQPGGGRCSSAAACARAEGFLTFSTSRPGVNRAGTDLFDLRRIAVKATTSGEDIARYCRFEVGGDVTRWAALSALRGLVGPKGYRAVRRSLLNHLGQAS
jgi:peptidoglycan/xylan/chitin deacetylase (PgdA/CDA1 family)